MFIFISMNLSEGYKNRLKELSGISKEKKFDPYIYTSFSSLTEDDLYDIARWGLMNDFYFSGAWDCGKDNLEKAAECTVDSFKLLLKDKFPEGFADIPSEIKIYRMIVLKNASDFNKNKLGTSWFTAEERITNNYFKDQLWHLKTKGLYLITAMTAEGNINIPKSLFQRDMSYVENEVVLKDDSPAKVKVISLDLIQ